MPEPAERRTHPRVTLDQQLEFLVGQMKGRARLTDISLAGLGLESPDPPLAVGSQARVSFMLGGKPLEADVVVTRSEDPDKVGAQFLQLAPHERFGLEEFIRYHQQRQSQASE